MVNYWLCVTNEENWEVVKERKLWGVSERNLGKLMKVKPGDLLVFYVKPKRVAGVFRAISDPFKSDKKIFSSVGFAKEEVFPHRVKLEPVIMPKEPIAFAEIVRKLAFIANKEKWYVYLRRAMQRLSKQDYEFIEMMLRR